MTNPANENVGCLIVSDFVDEGELPANLEFHRGEVVHPQVVADCVDAWSTDDGLKEFTVLLKDGRVVAVRGQGIKLLPGTAPGESGSYGIVVRSGKEEILVALFKAIEIIGIFHGEVRPDRKIA